MRLALLPFLALLTAGPAAAQQYWLPNGPGGTTWNNPQGSLQGTINEHMLQRHMQQRQWERQRQSGVAPAATRAPDPSFRLVNGGNRTIREVYVSPSTDRNWGPDRLGTAVVPPGQRFVIGLPRGACVNDLRIVFADGRAEEHRQLDTCRLTDVTVNERGKAAN
ncbi:hypothetical protein ACLF3G_19130 [Falsiroseomonas sp. HC035]|uniref:hypothetical protein n=1 Tax=Falsiroseomonas sp. HC035 TaxID=3390999 RepID=UPI003D31C170